MSESFSFSSSLPFSSFRLSATTSRPVGWVLSTVLLGILWLGAVPLAAQPNELNADQERLMKVLKHNGELMPEVDVMAEDGFFRAKIAAELAGSVEPLSQAYRVFFRFNEEEQGLGKCFVFRDRTDMANPLVQISDHYFANFAQTFGEIESKRVWAIDSGHVEGSPYLGLEWFYYGGSSDKQFAGHLKSWIAIKEERTIYCHGDSLGYSQTFFDLFAGFVESLEFKEPAPRQPYYEEVAVVEVDGENYGVLSKQYSVDGDGDLEYLETKSLMSGVGQDNPLAQDTTLVSYSSLAGDVLAESYVEVVNGKQRSLLHLEQSEDGTWSVSGISKGEEMSAELGEGQPRSRFGRRLDFVEFMKTAQSGAVLKHEAWMPSMAPTRWVDQELTYQGLHEDGLAISLDMGSTRLDGVADGDLSFKSMDMEVGNVAISLQRIFQRGDALYPKTLIDSAHPDSKSPMEASHDIPGEAPELASPPRP